MSEMRPVRPDERSAASCCQGDAACVFTKALLAHAARCTLAARQSVGETDALHCTSAAAQAQCAALSALIRERAAFALRLPRAPAPLMHARALQLQCGGLAGLQQVLQAPQADVHHLVEGARACHGSLLELPWQEIVDAVVAWQPRRRHPGPGA